MPKKEIFLEKWLRILLSSSSNATNLQKDPYKVNYETRLHYFGPNWAQIAHAQKRNFLVNWLILLWSNYFTPLYYISKFLESQSWDITAWDLRLHNFGPNWAKITKLCWKRIFSKKLKTPFKCLKMAFTNFKDPPGRNFFKELYQDPCCV